MCTFIAGNHVSYVCSPSRGGETPLEVLGVFVDNPNVRLDNNLSERNLRLIPLGRKNFLFVGHDQAGENLAILRSLVATCIAHDVNPQDYIADVPMRIQDHPQSAIDEIMPHRWTPRD